MYAGTVGLFSFGGISFDVARRFLAVAERYLDPAKPEAFFWRVMSFTHHFVSGDWDERHEIPVPLVEDALRRGQLWDVATHVGLESFKQLAQGRWADCTAHIDRLERIEEAYAYDLARSNRHAALAFLHAERRVLDAAEAAANVYLESNDEVLLNLLALGTKGKVQVLRRDLEGARATLATADGLLARQRVPPWYVGIVTRSHLLLRIAERELGIAAAPRRDRPPRRLRREARAAAARFAWLRPEVWQAIAQLDWLAGRRTAALRGFARALDEADRLGLRPDAARVRIEIARRLLEAGGGATFRGQDAPALVAAGRRELEALDLSWDLARLELALSRVQGRPLAAALR